jgi:hypothetical protein
MLTKYELLTYWFFFIIVIKKEITKFSLENMQVFNVLSANKNWFTASENNNKKQKV